MKLFAPLPLCIFHLSLCCFLPFWVSLVLHWFLAEVPQITLPVPCFDSCSSLLSVSFLSGLSQRSSSSHSSNSAGKVTKQATVVSEQPQGNRKRCLRRQRGTPGAPGARRRAQVAQAGPVPGARGSPMAPPRWYTPSSHRAGPRPSAQPGHGAARPAALSKALLLARTWRGKGAQLRLLMPWGEGSAADSLRLQSPRILFSLSSPDRQRGNY